MKRIDYKIFTAFVIFILMNVISIESIGSVHKKFNKLQNKSIVDSSKFLDLAIYYFDNFTNAKRGYTQVKVFKNDKLLRDIESDINGKLRLILEPENEFKIIAIIEGYPAMLFVNTKGVTVNFNANYHTLRYDFPVGKNMLVPPSNNEIVYKSAEVFFNPTLKKFKINSETEGFVDRSNLVDKEGKKVSFKVKILEKRGSIVRKNGDIVFYLSIRAADGSKNFNDCKLINNGKVILNQNNGIVNNSASDSAEILIKGDYNMEIKTPCSLGYKSDPADQQLVINIDCPNFFKKTIYLNLYGLFHKFNCNQTKPDTVNILLDSCFLEKRELPNIYIGGNYFYTSKGMLERNYKIQRGEEEDITQYLDKVKRARQFKETYYRKIKVKPEDDNVSSEIDKTGISEETARESTDKETDDKYNEVQALATEIILEMDSLDNDLPPVGKIDEVIFKNEKAEFLPITTKKKFEKFGFDTLRIYNERKVKEQLKLLEKSTVKLKTAEDTLILYSLLYKINKDFIYIGKKKNRRAFF